MKAPLPFDVTVGVMAYDLFVQVSNKQVLEKLKKSTFVMDSVINIDTGDEIVLGARIEEIMAKNAREKFPRFSVTKVKAKNAESADYMIVGAMQKETYAGSEAKLPHLFLSVIDTKTNMIVAHSEAWISDQDMKLLPTPLFSDSPMYVKDARVEELIAAAQAISGKAFAGKQVDQLATTALLSEASSAYEAGDYRVALGLFAKAAEKEETLTMKTLVGLYQCFVKLRNLREAEDAFAKLTEQGVTTGNLNVKFLFEVNDTALFGEQEEQLEYDIWLRQIAKKIDASSHCFQIIGHASRSGGAEYNKQLSFRRAEQIQRQLQSQFPGVAGKIVAVGKGFEENIVGNGANDQTDAIDRRVEFKIVDCASL